MRTPTPAGHGTNPSYNRGCRCRPCKDAHAAEQRNRRTHPRPIVSAIGAHRRIKALHRMGWSAAEISRRAGRSEFWTQQILRNTRVYQGTHDTIVEIYDALSMTWCDTARGRRVAAEARANGWPPPLAWDDDDLDNPDATPYADETPVDVDEAVVQRVLGGEWNLPTTKSEKCEITRRWYAGGGTSGELAAITGWKPERYVKVGEAA